MAITHTAPDAVLSLAASIAAFTDVVSSRVASDARIAPALQGFLPNILEATNYDFHNALNVLCDRLLFEGIEDMMKAQAPGSRVPLSRIVEEFGLDAGRLKALFNDAHPLLKRRKRRLARIGVSLIGLGNEAELCLVKSA
jgi:hypothetical protein